MKYQILQTKQFLFKVLVAGLATVMAGCSLDDPEALLEKVTEGVILNVNTDIFRVPVGVQLVNANKKEVWKNDNAVIRLQGKDADLIYATDGKKSFKPSQGFIELGVNKNFDISTNNPLDFVIEIKAEGFLPVFRKVSIKDTTYRLMNINLVELSDLPTGTEKRDTIVRIGDKGTEIDLSLEFEKKVDEALVPRVFIREGTKLANEAEEELTGEVEVQVVYFDGNSVDAQQAFPGGLVTDGVLDQQGNSMGTVSLVPVSFISFDMYVGDEEVKTFSDPVEVSVPINAMTINPETGSLIKAGDIIKVWSLNEVTGNWELEGETMVAMEDGQLFTTFEIPHLSWWSVHFVEEGACDETQPMTLNIISPFNNSCNAPVYYWELWSDEAPYGQIGTGQFLSVQNGIAHYMADIPSDKPVKLRMYNYIESNCRTLLYESSTFTTGCDASYTADLTMALADLQTYPIMAQMSGICSGSNSDLIVKPTFNVYYRPIGCEEWNFLGKAIDGAFCTANLSKGFTYDFRAFFGENSYDFESITIKNQTITYNDFSVDVVLGAESADLIIEDVVLDDEFCSLVQ